MENYKKNTDKKSHIEVKTPLFKKSDEVGKRCGKCANINHIKASFCGECGGRLDLRRCHKCGESVSENADFCENCKEWLLPEDICRFCGCIVDDEQAFCGECGNPPLGVICDSCGEVSSFDFCKNCNSPLTEQALDVIQLVRKKDRELIELLEVASSDSKDNYLSQNDFSQVDILRQIQRYVTNTGDKTSGLESFTPKKVDFFSEEQKEAIKQGGKVAKASIKERERILAEKKLLEEERKRKEEEARKQFEAEKLKKEKEVREKKEVVRKELVAQMKHKVFSSNQEARRYHRSIKPSSSQGWVCNFADVEHCCPEDCADPSHGGYWVI